MATVAKTTTSPTGTSTGRSLGAETRSIDWVPDAERHGKVRQQGMLWFLGNFQYFTIALGFVGPALGLPFGPSVLAGVLGIAVGTVFMVFHASQGPRLGLPQMIQSRAQFGFRGVVLVLFGALFTYVGFNVANQVLVSQGLHGAFGWNETAVAAGAATIAILLAVFGHDWVHRVFRWLLYASLPLMTLVTVGVLTGHAGGHAPSGHLAFGWAAFFAQFSVAAAYNITYAPYVSDYSRYLPRTTSARSLITTVFLGASGSCYWLLALGAWLATRLNATDALVALRDAGDHFIPGLGTVAAVLSAVTLIATMGMNAYGGMMTVLTGVDSFRGLDHDRLADHPERGGDAVHHADAGPVPAGPVDGDQPDGLLRGAPRALLHRRPVHPGRHLRRVGVARTGRLRHRPRGGDPLHGPARVALHRPGRPAPRRSRHLLARRPGRGRARLPRAGPVAGPHRGKRGRGPLGRLDADPGREPHGDVSGLEGLMGRSD
jgi:purine-cytosine permease-like protein